MRRRFAVLAVAIGVIAGVAVFASPASAQYIPGQPGCIPEPAQIDENVSTPGVVDCIGCPPNVQANAYVLVDGDEVLIGSAQTSTDDDGGVTIPVTYPALEAGDYTLLVRCGPVLLSNVLTVVGQGSDLIARGPLPVTGSDSKLLVQIALILVVVGGLLALSSRKRKHAYH